jgi:hypothetical protein
MLSESRAWFVAPERRAPHCGSSSNPPHLPIRCPHQGEHQHGGHQLELQLLPPRVCLLVYLAYHLVLEEIWWLPPLSRGQNQHGATHRDLR